jgi:hypothetical protein
VSVLCISGPCLPNNDVRPTSQLATQNADIAGAIAQLPFCDGHKLVACIDELPEAHGTPFQMLVCAETVIAHRLTQSWLQVTCFKPFRAFSTGVLPWS